MAIDNTRFKVRVEVRIETCGPNGEYYGDGRMQLSEETIIQASSFRDVATVLEGFHSMVEGLDIVKEVGKGK